MPKTTILDRDKKRAVGRTVSLLLIAMTILYASITCAEPQTAKTKEYAGDPQRSYGAIDVILYETGWCPSCIKAKAYLKDTGVSLLIYDIEKEPSKKDEMLAKSGRPGVPVVDIEGIILQGYSAEAIQSAIERKRREQDPTE